MKKNAIKVLGLLLCACLVFACVGCERTGPAVTTEEKNKVWSTYNTEKVIRATDRNAGYTEMPAAISIAMMKNEAEGAQLIITAYEAVSEFSLTPSALSDGKGNTISSDAISIYQQKYVHMRNKYDTEYAFLQAGDYVPDMLLPMDIAVAYKENKIAANNNQGITVEVKTTHETVPGTYTGSFVLDIDGNETSIPVSVEVWDIAYQGKRDFQSSFVLYPHRLLSGEYNNSEETINAYVDLLADYKVNTLVRRGNSYLPDSDSWVEREAELIKNDNYNSIYIPCELPLNYVVYNSLGPTTTALQCTQYIKALAKASSETEILTDYAYFYPFSTDEADLTPANWAASEEIFKPGGEIDKTLQLAIDELMDEGFFETVSQDLGDKIKASILDIPAIFVNVAVKDSWIESLNAVFCPYQSVFDNMSAVQKYQDAAAEYTNGKIWTYTCVGPAHPYANFHIDNALVGVRASAWMNKAYEINGFLYWAVNFYKSRDDSTYIDVYENPNRAGDVSGDGYLLYPGRYYNSSKPFASVRLTAYRDSMDDYDMLRVYENLLEEYAAKYGITINTHDYVNDLYDSLFEGAIFNTNQSFLVSARNELAKRILALKNNDHLLVHRQNRPGVNQSDVYSANAQMEINGQTVSGTAAAYGYKYTVVRAAGQAVTANVKTAIDEYQVLVYNNHSLINFQNTQSLSVSTDSTFVAGDDKIDVTIKSRYAGAPGVVDGATQRFIPNLTIQSGDLSGTKELYLSLKNTGTNSFEYSVDLMMGNSAVNVGNYYSSTGKDTQTLRIASDSIDWSKVTAIRIGFVNIKLGEDGSQSLFEARNFELTGVWASKT